MTHLRGVKPLLSPDREPLTKAPPVPKWLSDEAKLEWRRIMPRLIEDRIITKSDLAGVENYCLAMGRIREIETQLRLDPLDYKLCGLQTRTMQTARQLAAEYGLTPTSRARVGTTINNDDVDDDNPLAVV